MKITVLWARNGKDAVPGGLDVKDGGTVEDLMKAMEQKSREVYPLFYFLPEYIYSQWTPQVTKHPAQTYALVYWSIHYAKRILETFFVHQFSHGTMPIFNLFKNCTYYWGFAAFVSYFINHPLYTPVSPLKMYLG
eukprot:jgi/Pico_ML_1/51658/g234.t1